MLLSENNQQALNTLSVFGYKRVKHAILPHTEEYNGEWSLPKSLPSTHLTTVLHMAIYIIINRNEVVTLIRHIDISTRLLIVFCKAVM